MLAFRAELRKNKRLRATLQITNVDRRVADAWLARRIEPNYNRGVSILTLT
jgi:hypothetical protein